MTTTTGRFDLTRWDEEVYDDAEGAKLQSVLMAKTFAGGIDGTSTGRLLQAFAADEAAAYVGIERVTGELDGREGSFVLRHSAVGSSAGGSMSVDVVPGSATWSASGASSRSPARPKASTPTPSTTRSARSPA